MTTSKTARARKLPAPAEDNAGPGRTAEETPAKPRRKLRKMVTVTSDDEPQGSSKGVADALRQIALDLFASQNYSTVTIKDISSSTGVNPSLIYYYFGSKEALFLNAVNDAVEKAFAQFELVSRRGDSPEDVISAWIEVHIVQFIMLQKLAKISLDYACTSSRKPHVDKAIRKFYDKEAVVLSRAIRQGISRGIFRETDPMEMATFISTFLDGVLFRNVMFPTFDYTAAIRHMRSLVLDQLRKGA
ncbi:TetR/AcrR family transcriptional regulator [Zavarzinia sp.]|uniref:TetR/AcrR family transcriptional regulator n=1 Tax=Zavarzinia sp. TaxID=2027920 RepID=UPI0035688F46